MVYRIKLEQFEGPLDVLLQLTQSQKLDITRVSLAKVADQYLEYMGNKKNVSLENMAEFLSVAAKLILIKSKALLPLLKFTEEEEQEIKDLEYQLAEYKRFKEIVNEIAVLADDDRVAYGREKFFGVSQIFYPPEGVGLEEIARAFQKMLGEIPAIDELEQEAVKEILTLEEKIVHLQDTLRNRLQVNFSEIVRDAKNKVEVVVSFLALLELIKQKIVHVEQNEIFQDIVVKQHKKTDNK